MTLFRFTGEYWTQRAHQQSSESRGKELRRDGFQMADEKYQVYKPILDEIEKIQKEAELEDVDVSRGSATKASGVGVESRHRR